MFARDANDSIYGLTPGPHIGDKQELTGVIIASIAYGVVIQLFLDCIQLLRNTKHVYSKNMRWFLFLYIIGTVSLATAAFVQGAHAIITVYGALWKVYPKLVTDGGARGIDFTSLPLESGTPIILPFTVLTADSFMLWRCMVLYRSASRGLRIFVYICLAMTLFASIGNVIIFFLAPMLLLGPVALAALTLAINLILALLITFRILHHQKYLKSVLGAEHGSIYNRVITMSVESCALIAAVSGTYLALVFWRQNAAKIPLAVLPQISAISPFFIIMRVAQGRAAEAAYDDSDSTLRNVGRNVGMGRSLQVLEFARDLLASTDVEKGIVCKPSSAIPDIQGDELCTQVHNIGQQVV